MIKAVVAAIAIATFVSGYTLGTMDNSSLSGEEIKEIILEINSKTDPVPIRQAPQPSAPSIIDVSVDDDPVKGNPDAPITIIEFSDFQCPFCSKFYAQTLPQIEKNYIDTGMVKLVYRDLPLSFHPNAKPASIAAECADEQGKFWEYHDVLFENQASWQSLGPDARNTEFSTYASDMGLNLASFDSCVNSVKTASEVTADSLDAAKYGATGTPTFFIGNEKDGFIKLIGAQPYASFQNAIDSQLG